ncbi:hypothetical protein [Aestuariivirga sp.]|uniref:hypothetical protein n=1 Tax=Aestuariivirga sp. TaxID=2650926 RepID=UPI003593B699
MKGAARLFLTLAIIYALCGMILGIYMAASENHTQMPTHAHTMVAGWIMSSVFAFFYHFFPEIGAKRMAYVHFWLQGISGVVLVVSLFFYLGGNPNIGPITGLASYGFFAGMLVFAWNALPVIRTA